MKETMQGNSKAEQVAAEGVSRRKFLTYAGALTGASVLLDACTKPEDDTEVLPPGTIDLGTGDKGLLNYAYLLEQLEADFYIKVMKTPFADITREELRMLEDIRDHEIAHREFYRNFLAGEGIPLQEFNFGSVDFTSRSSVMETARTLEETGVSAYSGAIVLIVSTDNLQRLSKIASVEARHAAVIRNTIKTGSFADTTNENGIDSGKSPADILEIIKPFLKSNISGNNLPKK